MRAEEFAKQFLGIPTGNLSDAMGKKGSMHSSIKPVYPAAKMAGVAFTAACRPGDNLTIHKAMDMALPGSVIVVNAGGYTEGGMFGDIMALACKIKGIAGVVIDGGCRDIEEIEALGFPLFARGVNPGGTIKENLGVIGEPIQCGGVLVAPGDIVVGDRDGVVVIPAAQADHVLEKARTIIAREAGIRDMLHQDKSTMEIFGLDALLKDKGQ